MQKKPGSGSRSVSPAKDDVLLVVEFYFKYRRNARMPSPGLKTSDYRL
jgi:hypothetical protein